MVSEQARLVMSALKEQKVTVDFRGTPLYQAIDFLADEAQVNMYFDSNAVQVESVNLDSTIGCRFPTPDLDRKCVEYYPFQFSLGLQSGKWRRENYQRAIVERITRAADLLHR